MKTPNIQLLQEKNFPKMKWKNGKGESSQIAIFPPDAQFPENFLWRLSASEIREAGSFSEFQGYDRYIALVEGKSLKLIWSHAQEISQEKILKLGEAVAFSGDVPTLCELPGGPIKDLNFIFKRGEVQVNFEILTFEEKPRSFQLSFKKVFLCVLEGKLIAEVFPNSANYSIGKGSVLQIDLSDVSEECLILLDPKKQKARIAFVGIK